MTHTPGPWAVGGEEDNALWVTGPDTSANVVCDLLPRQFGKYVSPLWHEEDRANARLIAAAPDLLAALKRNLPAIRMTANLDDAEAAEAAIAKAEEDAAMRQEVGL